MTSLAKYQSNNDVLSTVDGAGLVMTGDVPGRCTIMASYMNEMAVFRVIVPRQAVGERCELKSRCTLQGDLKAARLVIEEGATFIGKSEVTSGKISSPSSNSGSRPEISRNDDAPASAKPAFAGRS